MKRILAAAVVVVLSGCSVAGRYCDDAHVAAATSHASHLTAGWPIGQSREEDSLDTTGLVGRCSRGPVYVETGLGYKFREGGFYGPDEVFQVNIGVILWRTNK